MSYIIKKEGIFKMEQKHNNEMETMNIKKLALKVSIPMVISMISIALYGIVDTIFISKISEEALTAVSLSVPLQYIITAIGLGTGIGVNSILAKTLGEKNDKKAIKIIFNGIILIFISWIIIALLSIKGINYFFNFFTDNDAIHKLGCNYLSIIAMFSIGSLYQILIEKILEAYGKSKSSMIVQFGGAIINLILDPILIFGFWKIQPLGIKGAAISSVIGQMFGMIVGISILAKNKIIKIQELKNIKLNLDIVKSIYKVGIPTIILESASSFITLILNKILISFSESAVAVWGIYNQLQRFIIIIVYGLNYGMIPIVAYNWGAKNKKRIKDSIKFFIQLAISVTLLGEMLFLLIPKQLIMMFNSSTEILEIAIPAFRILSIGFVFAGISLVLSSTFQAFGKGTYSLIVNMSRQIIFVLPFILILKVILGIYSVWISFTIAEILTMFIAILLFKKINKNIIETI
jgi:putative MATE family efflux protein